MNLFEFLSKFPVAPVQFVYGLIALCGGVARYLSGYTHGSPFNISMFFASAFIAGFSGWMFATLGIALDLPQGIIFTMAGTGGFFGEQTLKLIYEFVQLRTIKS